MSYVSEARKFVGAPAKLSPDWSLEPVSASDLIEVYGYYQTVSGGLLPEALDRLHGEFDDRSLADLYKENGLFRQRDIYALRYQGNAAKALIDVQSSDFGLNLSEITNSISVYLIDPQPEYFDMIRFAVYHLALEKDKMSAPVMVFPNTYLNSCGFNTDKEYTMWTLNVPQGMESYMTWMNRYCK